MSSVGGRIAQPFLGPYSASKYALEAIGDVMRRELLRFGIHVALIEPGNIKTRIWEKGASQVQEFRGRATEEQLRLYGRNIEQMEKVIRFADRTGASPDKVARAIAHALTADRPRARYLVGADARVQLAVEKGPADARGRPPLRALRRRLIRPTGLLRSPARSPLTRS